MHMGPAKTGVAAWRLGKMRATLLGKGDRKLKSAGVVLEWAPELSKEHARM